MLLSRHQSASPVPGSREGQQVFFLVFFLCRFFLGGVEGGGGWWGGGERVDVGAGGREGVQFQRKTTGLNHASLIITPQPLRPSEAHKVEVRSLFDTKECK